MTSIPERIVEVRARIERACRACGRDPAEVELLAVSKTHSVEVVREALAAGQVVFGENRVQELVPKAEALEDTGVRWHMIGSVQTNKVRQLCGVQSLVLVHGVDRPKLAQKLADVWGEVGRRLDVLVQINATGDGQKHGSLPAEIRTLAELVVAASPTLNLLGVMAMGPLEGDPTPVFAEVARIHAGLRDVLGLPLPILSLGMSADLEQGIAAGSTMVRIGTDVFGPRVQKVPGTF